MEVQKFNFDFESLRQIYDKMLNSLYILIRYRYIDKRVKIGRM